MSMRAGRTIKGFRQLALRAYEPFYRANRATKNILRVVIAVAAVALCLGISLWPTEKQTEKTPALNTVTAPPVRSGRPADKPLYVRGYGAAFKGFHLEKLGPGRHRIRGNSPRGDRGGLVFDDLSLPPTPGAMLRFSVKNKGMRTYVTVEVNGVKGETIPLPVPEDGKEQDFAVALTPEMRAEEDGMVEKVVFLFPDGRIPEGRMIEVEVASMRLER